MTLFSIPRKRVIHPPSDQTKELDKVGIAKETVRKRNTIHAFAKWLCLQQFLQKIKDVAFFLIVKSSFLTSALRFFMPPIMTMLLSDLGVLKA